VLLDEPFSNLDVDLRERLSVEVREILKSEGMTAVLVTHDQHEAFAMADEIGVMFEGRIQQWDTPYNLYHRPGNRFVADFVGKGVFVPARCWTRQVEIELGVLLGRATECSRGCAACGKGCRRGCAAAAGRRDPRRRQPDPRRGAAQGFSRRRHHVHPAPGSGTEVLSLVPSHHNHAIGEKIGVRLEADHVIAFRHGNPGLEAIAA
jgi:iron(III) transport system ATP-binding protein